MFSFCSLPLFFASASSRRLFVFASVLKACLAICFLTLLLALPSHAQWSVVDQNGNPISQSNDGSYSLLCAPSGSGTSTYPKDLPSDYIYHTSVFGPYYFPSFFDGPPPANLSSGLGAFGWAENNAWNNPYY